MVARAVPAADVAEDAAAARALGEVGRRPDVVEPAPLVGRPPVGRPVGPPGIEPPRRQVCPRHVDEAAAPLHRGERRDLDRACARRSSGACVVPDIVLARRDVEVADEDRPLRRAPPRTSRAVLRGRRACARTSGSRPDRAGRRPPARRRCGSPSPTADGPTRGARLPACRNRDAARSRAAGATGSPRRCSPSRRGRRHAGSRARGPRRAAGVSTGALVSCRQSKSGSSSRRKRSTRPARKRSELMFQVAIRRVMVPVRARR